jgi:hypothetical protein
MPWRRLVVVAVVATGCAPAAAAPASTPPPAAVDAAPTEPTPQDDAEQTLATIESALVEGEHRGTFRIVAEGVVTASVRGELVLGSDAVQIRATGTMAGAPLEVELLADGRRMRGTAGERSFDLPQADALRDALAVGLIRMGILHNVAVLNGARPPDHAEGGVRDWVQIEAPTRARTVTELEPTRDDLPSPPISMEIVVDGQPAGRATVWIDPDTNLPVERHQVVRFPEGEMRVRETYTWM